MKAIIDGIRYDTDKAECIAGDCGGEGKRDFNWFDEDLYRTAKGRWFIAGEGGPRSKYAETVGQNRWSSGSRIIPLTPDEARQWLEHAGKTACIEKYFGDAIEDA